MDTHPTCEVCDRSDDTVEYWQQGAQAHVGCVPAYWKTDRAAHETFQARLHRVRYELTSEGTNVTGRSPTGPTVSATCTAKPANTTKRTPDS